jgi:leucyl aminopeptidase (aminopeptidase T)
MVMIGRYGSPTSRLISVMKSLQVPVRSVQPGDRLLVITDDAMDPLVWQSMMAAINEKGGEAVLCMWPRLAHHFADPPKMAIEAAREADAIVALTTTALSSGSAGARAMRAASGGPMWLMEEMTVEILTEGGGRANMEQVKEMCALGRRVGEVYDRGKKIHILSDAGTDLTAEIGDTPPSYYAERWGGIPFGRNAKTGKLGGGTWPWGEAHLEPLPGTANGTMVWEVTAQFPPGRWRNPVTLIIKDGRVVDIQGKTEAEQVRWFLETYGDENSWLVGGEIALGLNKLCQPNEDSVRSWKKHYGAMHFGIGHGADRRKIISVQRLEGVIEKVTMVVDDTVVCEKGKILV